MAGKHSWTRGDNYDNPTTAGNLANTPNFPGGKADRAYAEGRAEAAENGAVAAIGANPHPSGTPAFYSWNNGAFYIGNAAAKLQTAVD